MTEQLAIVGNRAGSEFVLLDGLKQTPESEDLARRGFMLLGFVRLVGGIVVVARIEPMDEKAVSAVAAAFLRRIGGTDAEA